MDIKTISIHQYLGYCYESIIMYSLYNAPSFSLQHHFQQQRPRRHVNNKWCNTEHPPLVNMMLLPVYIECSSAHFVAIY